MTSSIAFGSKSDSSIGAVGRPTTSIDGSILGEGYDVEHIAAATVLLRISPDDEDILPTLLHALYDREEPDKRLRTAAVKAIGNMGPRARVAEPELLELIRNA
jgi:hypothetical protein